MKTPFSLALAISLLIQGSAFSQNFTAGIPRQDSYTQRMQTSFQRNGSRSNRLQSMQGIPYPCESRRSENSSPYRVVSVTSLLDSSIRWLWSSSLNALELNQ